MTETAEAKPTILDCLRPCPFCGGVSRMSARAIDAWSQDRVWYVTCEKCKARGPEASHSAEAEQLWRKRLEV